MMFMRHDRSNANKLRTNSERCAQVGALFATLLVIATAVVLYFGITTEHGQQKTVFFIITVVNIISLCILIGITVYYVRKFMIREELSKMNAKHQQQSTPSLRHNQRFNSTPSQQQLTLSTSMEFSNQHKPKVNYALNQPVPILIHNNTTFAAATTQDIERQQPINSSNNNNNSKSFGFYQI